jgi:REP element-mobilizing transposase RayT
MSRAYKMHHKDGYYFISFATVAWFDLFTRVIYKDILLDSIRYCQKEKGLVIHAWCIMTNHVHLVISRQGDLEISGILRDLKKYTSKTLIKAIQDNIQESRKDLILYIFKSAGEYNPNNKTFQLWQQDNRPIEIYSNEVMEQKLDYIHDNPLKAGIVDKAEHYLYSSARDYAGVKGLLEIEMMI